LEDGDDDDLDDVVEYVANGDVEAEQDVHIARRRNISNKYK
jgi:hypothetical protein